MFSAGWSIARDGRPHESAVPRSLPKDATMKRTEIAETNLSYFARVSRRSAARAALTACVIATLPAVGCRSGKPSWNMFSRSEPSAEVLAGSGPTTTYPSPPSSRARPEAIASIAGGTAGDTSKVASDTPETLNPETGSPATAANPYALAGNRMKAPENAVPSGFPTGPVTPAGPRPTVSTTLAASDSAVPPSYALPGRSGVPASNDLAATANGFGDVPAAVSPSKPPDADGLPSGYQLGKEPVASPDAAIASSSPESTSPNSSMTMPPVESTASADAPTPSAPARSSGFGLPEDMIPAVVPSVAAAPTAPPAALAGGVATGNPAEATPANMPTSPAIVALGLPPADTGAPANVQTASATTSPAFQTAANTQGGSASGDVGAATNSGQPAGYMPGSTGKSSGYPVLR